MRPLIIFIVIVAAVFLAGAVLSFPVYTGLAPIIHISYRQAVHFTILLIGLLLAAGYLYAARELAPILGWNNGTRANLRSLIVGLGAGLALLSIIELCLYLLGMRQADPALDNGAAPFLLALLKALLTGCVVGATEEVLYRGAIFSGLARYSNALTALIVSSLFYGAVHFIHFLPPPAGTTVSWTTGLHILAGAFYQFTDPLILDSLFSLTLLGLLFGLLRWQTGNIILCIGLHAGIVAANKIYSYATDFKTGSPHAYLVNNYDHLTGALASFWLLLAGALYYLLIMKKSRPDRSTIKPDD